MYKYLKYYLLFMMLSCSLLYGFSQAKYSTDSKRAIKKYEQGLQQFSTRDKQAAVETFNKAIDIDPDFIEAYLLLAECYIQQGDISSAIKAYKNGLDIDPSFFPNGFFDLANLELSIGRYEDAVQHFEQLLSLEKGSDDLKKKAKEQLVSARFGLEAVNNPVPFEPKNMGDSINSEYHDYWPTLSADEKTMVITVLLPKDKNDPRFFGNRQEDFFISHKIDGKWTEAENIGPPLNTPDNEGAQSVMIDGKGLFYTACNREQGFGLCDLHFSKMTKDGWAPGINLAVPINTIYSEKQPSISSDGRSLYFASNRKGTHGKLDLYVSHLSDEGYWTKPENLGDVINTQEDDAAPFIHPDGKTLYFCSKGHVGLGGFDIFMSQMDSGGQWQKPKNLGYPINTWNEEEGLILNAAGNMAYFSSDRLDGIGKRDIYEFELYKEARPTPVSYMKGKVFDAESYQRLQAHFELIDLSNREKIMEAYSDKETGAFFITIPSNKNYALNVSKEGYLFYSQNFSLKGVYEFKEPFLMDVPLDPIKVGSKIVLNNIFFEVDSYKLKEESEAELDKIIAFLKNNPTLKVEISGHTDSTASEAYNQQLSEQRAHAVVDYLVAHDIADERLTYKGYGEAKPVASNKTEEGRAKNRRTELKVIAK